MWTLTVFLKMNRLNVRLLTSMSKVGKPRHSPMPMNIPTDISLTRAYAVTALALGVPTVIARHTSTTPIWEL